MLKGKNNSSRIYCFILYIYRQQEGDIPMEMEDVVAFEVSVDAVIPDDFDGSVEELKNAQR